MKAKAVQPLVTTVALVLVGFCNSFSQSNQSSGTPSSEISAKPLLLEKTEGELRTRRIHTDASVPASSQFMLKVSPKNNGSQHLVAGTENVAPGVTLLKHRHLTQDEIVLIHSGTAHVWLGDQERDLHAGGLVFIPANGASRVKLEELAAPFTHSQLCCAITSCMMRSRARTCSGTR